MPYLGVMDIKLNILISVILGVAFVSLIFGCKDCDPIPVKSFGVTFSLFPEKREYKVGDTIIFLSEILKSDVFPQGVNPSNVEIASQISTGQLLITETGYKQAAADKFDHSIIRGFQYPLTHKDSLRLLDWNLANFIYEEIDGKYVAEIITIPKDTGTYLFSPFSGGLKINKGDRCEEFNVFEVHYINRNTNIDILENFDHNVYNEENRRNHYTFFVKHK